MKVEWKGLTFIVGEMSRAQALRFTDEALTRFKGDDESTLRIALREYDPFLVSFTPIIVQQNGATHARGERTFMTSEGAELVISLPITESAFDDLPKSLADELAKAAYTANIWIDGDLKNEPSLTTATNSEPQSGKLSS